MKKPTPRKKVYCVICGEPIRSGVPIVVKPAKEGK
jgi:hypothetical protein